MSGENVNEEIPMGPSSNDVTPNTRVKPENSVEMHKSTLLGIAVLGVCMILTMGLISGFVIRPGNCVSNERPATTVTPSPTQPTPSSQTSSQSTQAQSTQATQSTPATRPTVTVPEVTNATSASTRTTPPPSPFRLPTNVVPSRYELNFNFDFNPYSNPPEGTQLNYTGSVLITVDVTTPTSSIVFHMDRSVQLTDSNIVITNVANGQVQQIASHNYGLNQLYQINLAASLPTATYTILLRFRSRTNEDIYYHGYLDGFARRSLVASMLAPVFARTAFPCFDEPSFKAKFVLTIDHPDRSIAVSSFPISSRKVTVDPTTKQARARTSFMETYSMSTYHLSWAILPDDFESRSAQTQGITVSVHGRRTEINENFGDFALQTAVKLINELTAYTGITEALPPKIDLVALPFFPYPASPAFGLNGFREDDLLYNAKVNSEIDKQRVATLLAYEIARNWFGSYVTCSYWDDLWLNEGLAVHFAYKALSSIADFADWQMNDQFLTDHTIPVMWRDAYQRELPLKFTITSNVDLRRIFTPELQSKSAAIFRMIETSVSAQNFKEDVIKYLSSHPFGVTTSNYFYAIFRSPNENAISMRNWIEPYVIQKNYPLVQVETRISGSNSIVDFSESRYRLTTINLEFPQPNLSWPVFLRCEAGGDANSPLSGPTINFDYLLTGKTGSYQLPSIVNWVKCNNDFGGYYMTNYSSSYFESFEQVLLSGSTVFSPADRANLIHLSFELAFVGIKSYQVPAYLSEYLQSNENQLVPWKAFAHHINKLAKITDHRPAFKNLRGYALQLLDNTVTRLGLDIWSDSSSHNEELLKIQIAELQCRLLDADCLNKATELFNSIPDIYFIDPISNQNLNPLSTNIRAIVYKYHLQNTNNVNDWYDIYDFYAIANDLREKEYAIEALSSSRQNFILDFLLSEILNTESRINDLDTYLIISSMGVNPSGRYFAWYFVREHWGDFYLQGYNMRRITLALRDIADTFEAAYLLEELLFFFEITYDFENGDLRSQMTESLIINTRWVFAYESDFKQFFFELPFKNDKKN